METENMPQNLTPFLKGAPPCKGWWNTKRNDVTGAQPAIIRRFYNGDGTYSGPVVVGKASDADCAAALKNTSVFTSDELLYQGLATQPAEPYPYDL